MIERGIGNGLSDSGREELEARIVATKVSTINGRETVGLNEGVSGNEEIGNEMLPRPAFAPIAKEGLAC